jgi:hypothetical protein
MVLETGELPIQTKMVDFRRLWEQRQHRFQNLVLDNHIFDDQNVDKVDTPFAYRCLNYYAESLKQRENLIYIKAFHVKILLQVIEILNNKELRLNK